MQHLTTWLRCGRSYNPMTHPTFKYLLAAIGLVTLLGSLVVCDHTASFVRRAARAQGTVTALMKHDNTDYSNRNGAGMPTPCYAYQAVVRFRYGTQQTLFYDSVATNPPAYHVGETVNVLYLESDPSDARIESFTSLWLAPMIFGGIGTILLAVGASMIIRSSVPAGRTGT
jgi:hypothetical protein